MRVIFFFDITPGFEPAKARIKNGQSIDVLDHNVTAAVASTSTVFLCATTTVYILAKHRCTAQLAKLSFNHSIARTHS